MAIDCNNHGQPGEIDISRDELAKLGEYSCSLPTSPSLGRRWRKDRMAFRNKPNGEPYKDEEHEHMVAWTLECACCPPGSKKIAIAWAWAIDPETTAPHRGKLR